MLLSTTSSTNFLKHIMGGSSSLIIGSNNNCWMGLFTVAPNEGGSGYTEVSPSGNNYERTNIASFMSNIYQSHANGDTEPRTYTRRIGNVSDILFNEAYDPSDPDAASGADWGTVVAIGLFTAKTGGPLYAWATLDTPVAIATHNVFLFRKGCFEVYLDESVGE